MGKTNFTKTAYQRQRLEAYFANGHSSWEKEAIIALSRQVGLTRQQVYKWMWDRKRTERQKVKGNPRPITSITLRRLRARQPLRLPARQLPRLQDTRPLQQAAGASLPRPPRSDHVGGARAEELGLATDPRLARDAAGGARVLLRGIRASAVFPSGGEAAADEQSKRLLPAQERTEGQRHLRGRFMIPPNRDSLFLVLSYLISAHYIDRRCRRAHASSCLPSSTTASRSSSTNS